MTLGRLASFALVATTALSAAACNNTLTNVALPANANWQSMTTYLASTANDLEVTTTGTGITANLVSAPFAITFCGNDVTGDNLLNDGPCPAGYTDYGTRYPYQLNVQVTPTFTPGNVQLNSATDGSSILAFTLTRNSSNALNMVAGFSEGTVPVRPTSIGADPLTAESFVADNYLLVQMMPHDPDFQNNSCFSNSMAMPVIACTADTESPGTDQIIYDASTTMSSASCPCGNIPVTISRTPKFKSVGQCISETRKTSCAAQGLKGTDLAACNAAVIGSCQASFNVPSRLAAGR